MTWTRTFIIGGGSSAAAFDFSRLHPCIGVNTAGLRTPCEAIFSLDKTFIVSNRSALASYPGEVHLCLTSGLVSLAPENATVWRRVEHHEPVLRPRKIGVGLMGAANSGLAAMNLAAHKGARTIVLVGFDLDLENRYWFTSRPRTRRNVDDIIQNFAYCAGWYQRRGIDVLNASPTSRLTCFRKITPDEVYA